MRSISYPGACENVKEKSRANGPLILFNTFVKILLKSHSLGSLIFAFHM